MFDYYTVVALGVLGWVTTIALFVYSQKRIYARIPNRHTNIHEACENLVIDGVWIALSRYMDQLDIPSFKRTNWALVASKILPSFEGLSSNPEGLLDFFCKASDDALSWEVSEMKRRVEGIFVETVSFIFNKQEVGQLTYSWNPDTKKFEGLGYQS